MLKSLAVSDIFCTFVPVNEKVTDISEALLTMTEEMRLMRETIDSQHADICRLNRNIDRLNADLRKRDKKNAAPAIEKIKECIMKSAVVGFDESGLYCNKKLDWAWIAQTVYFTLLFHGSGRSHKELESRFGSSLERMVAVTDRHSAYFTLNFLNHQVCVAHLLRELQYLNELDTKQQWSKKVESLLQQAVHERNENPQAIIDKQPWLIKLDQLLTENLEHMAEQFGKLKNGLIKCRDYIFNFLENPAIPPDNNASERGIRKVKIKMKNSGTFRSDTGADAFLELLSIVETTKKNNNSPYTTIRALF